MQEIVIVVSLLIDALKRGVGGSFSCSATFASPFPTTHTHSVSFSNFIVMLYVFFLDPIL